MLYATKGVSAVFLVSGTGSPEPISGMSLTVSRFLYMVQALPGLKGIKNSINMSSNGMAVCNQPDEGIIQSPLTDYFPPEIKVVSIAAELGFVASLEDHIVDPEQSW